MAFIVGQNFEMFHRINWLNCDNFFFNVFVDESYQVDQN